MHSLVRHHLQFYLNAYKQTQNDIQVSPRGVGPADYLAWHMSTNGCVVRVNPIVACKGQRSPHGANPAPQGLPGGRGGANVGAKNARGKREQM
ncbi:hypothetical protein L596_008049 [Steinernema carpocapsae]|uniref:Uncharacterized protein n=1 Tax=Steinernema carpocapsae TaxID=34508 RepID=A0A4V6A6A8_STECR|nr:hypothetical protein L596_008049 [Steinernema carpocapsae]